METNVAYSSQGNNQIYPVTLPMGGVTLNMMGRRNTFEARYQGGGFIYDNGAAPSSSFDVVNLTDSIQFRRGTLSLDDLFSYMPQAGFGLAGVGVLGGFGSGLFGGFGFSSGQGQVNPVLVPNESILSTGYAAYSNTALIQGVYELGSRTSISAVGGYGTLQFGNRSSLGFLNGNEAEGLVGLNRQLSARNTLGVSYMYSKFGYVGSPNSFDSQSAFVTFGRKITGRLALQVYFGPEFTAYTVSPTQTVHSVYTSGTASLSYQLRRSSVSFYGGRFAAGGSGLEPGTETTMLSGSWSRTLTRTWSVSAYVGYSRNSGLISSTGQSTHNHYNYWFGEATLDHNLGRYVRFYAGYEYQRQTTNTGPCTRAACAAGLSNQALGIGFMFTPHPIGL